ncbi:hypothetical protein BN1708_010955 [Verticillium longisporum]|uniref:Major facilitator superfamily (MFS) profile domain-containing protein n=1 Tax=Verticillium longisporum TaxID=100787 RepID=A0A0G4KVK7_VERLO|nr:hypothetical protein BN1708_010955 [Verticillium longisporum]
MDKATRISIFAKPATSHEAPHKARVVSLDIPPPVPPKDPPRPATSSTTRSGPATRPVANATTKLKDATTKLKDATMSSRPTTSSTRPGTSSTLAGTMSSIQGAGSKIKAGLRPLKLAALTSHPTRPMPTISRPQTASNTTVASPVRPMTSSTRRFSRSTTMTGRTIKYGSGRYATTELSPQPSDDEDDPLNWPLWKKDLNLFALLVTVCLVSAMKTAFIPVAAKLAIQFQVSHTAIASLTAVPFIFSSITGLASVTASKIWGKRPVYLLSMVFLFIGSLWNMRSTTFGTTLGARIFQGIGWGAFDTLILSSIHDTYFGHQRNPRLAAYDILQAATAWGPPLLSGVAMRNAGRFEIHFEILNTFFIVAIPLLAFAAPETAYDRWFIGNALPSARTPTSTTARRSIGKFNLHVPNTHEARQYLRTMKPISSFRGFVDNRTLLQGPRALIAPTTALLALATFLPYSALWAIAHVVSPLTAAILDEAQIGSLLLAPFICGVSAAALFAFWRRKARKDFTLLNLVAALGGIGWGAFDTLILSSIHDTYFEHQRNPRLAAYDILQAATAWGPPLLSGVAMRNAARFEIHFEILNTFFIVAIPLLAFAAPETAYDRWFIGNALPSARTPTWTTARRSIGKFNLHVPNTHEARQYLRTMKPISSFRGFVDNRTLLQGPRALIAPTTALLALATFLPYSALWAIAHVVSPLTAAILDEAQIGFLLLAPFICGVSAAALFAFWRRKARKDFTLLNLVAALGVGTVLAAIGILSFGLEIHGSRNISFKLLSVLAGFLAVGVYVLNALARPVIYRSAQYTSSNLHVCLRNVADMDAGLVCWKNLFAAFFILGVASAVEARRSAGLRSSVIGIGVSQIFVALFVGTVWWFMDERLRRLDGRVMGLVDLDMLKRAGSFFDED